MNKPRLPDVEPIECIDINGVSWWEPYAVMGIILGIASIPLMLLLAGV